MPRDKNPIAEGDRVMFSRSFLRNTLQHTGPKTRMRGTVEKLLYDGQMALVKWDAPDFPGNSVWAHVNTLNLTRVKEIGLEEP